MAQIWKLRALQVLCLTSYAIPIRELDTGILLFGLKDLQHLHICVPAEESLLAISRCCPALEYLHIADFGSSGGITRLKHVQIFNDLRSSIIHTLNLFSSLYHDDFAGACAYRDILWLCQPNTILRMLIVGIMSPHDADTDDFIVFAVDESKGQVELIPEVLGSGNRF